MVVYIGYCPKPNHLTTIRIAMKNKLIVAITASFFAFAAISADAQTTAVTTPVGYHTLFIKRSPTGPLFNFVGTNFTKKILAAGAITMPEAANVITDANANFTTSLAGGINLFVEITSNTGGGVTTVVGSNTNVTAFGATTLTTSDDLSTVSDPGDNYIVRETMTIRDIFGPNNEAGLAGQAAGVLADVIWVPNGSGGFDQIFYNTVNNPMFGITAGWKRVGSGDANFGTFPVYFTDGIYIERKLNPFPNNTDVDIVITGHVDTEPVVIPVVTGFNYFDRRYPVGATLGNCNLYGVDLDGNGLFTGPGESAPAAGVPPAIGSLDPAGAGPSGNDVVWLQTADRLSFDQYFFNTTNNPMFGITPGWKRVGSGDVNQSFEPLRAGFIVERRQAAFNLGLVPDAAIYDEL